MSVNLKVLQVFIASPSDLEEERRAINRVVDTLNNEFGKEFEVHVRLLGWEDVLPGYGRPQEQINEDVDRADLFLGFLWKRWGSDTGNPKYSSGFEEEFRRAMERRENSGAPEICLFFKAMDGELLKDPGEQLKRVIQFRTDIEKSKKIFFRNFTDLADWKEQTRSLLQRHLIKLYHSAKPLHIQLQGQTIPEALPEHPVKEAAGNTSETPPPAANRQIVEVWSEALNAIKLGELSEFSRPKSLDKLQVARLGLAVAGITNRDIETKLPGVHLINMLFKEREKVELNQLEWLLVLRGNLDVSGGYRAGWYWLRKKIRHVKALLLYIACNDDHVGVRKAAFGYVKMIGISLHNPSRGKPRAIDILSSHSDAVTRILALEYLADLGGKMDLELADKLRTDPEADVRHQAETARNAILLRLDASKFFEDSVLTCTWVSEEDIAAVRRHAAKIDPELLKKSLTHPDAKVQFLAGNELMSRSLIEIEEIEALEGIELPSEIRQLYYLNAISRGKMFTPGELRKALIPKTLHFYLDTKTDANVNLVIGELFKHYKYDELITVLNSESDDALIAYRTLANVHFQKFGDQVRNDLRTGFAALMERFKVTDESAAGSGFRSSWSSLFGSGAQVWSPSITEYLVAGLSGLAINGKTSDRELTVAYLAHKSEPVRIAAIACLAQFGAVRDAELVMHIAEISIGEVSIAAAKTALALSPGIDGSAGRLVESGKPEFVKLALRSLIGGDWKAVWPRVERLLFDKNDDIRALICAYAVKELPSQRLGKLLDVYLTADSYFYNVVYFLDRALYGKPPLRDFFVKEIEAFLD